MNLKYLSVVSALVLLFALLAACSDSAPTPPSVPGNPAGPALPDLPAGEWATFEPEGETICADGSPYAYFVRPGTVNKLVVDFQGGGACWNGETCGEAVYTPSVGGAPGAPGGQPLVGLYDHANEQNPVADWYHVYISYCTADIHLGDSVETYETPGSEQTINHNGQNNVEAVLDWVENEFEAPEAIFVTGCSAGAYGAALYTPQIAEAYPDADVAEFGDCGAGIIPESFVEGEDGLNRWNIDTVLPDGVDPSGGVPATFLADAYTAIGEAYPDVTLAQYNSAFDGTQIFFYAYQLGGSLPDEAALQEAGQLWNAGLTASLGQIQAELPESFSSYTSLLEDNRSPLPGTAHCVITKPEFYTLATDGVLLTDWLNDLLNDPAPPAPVTPPVTPS